MTGFLIKKVFFDLWDNFLGVFVLNSGYTAIVVLAMVLANVVPGGFFASLLFYGFLALAFAMYSLGVSGVSYSYSQYHKESWRCFKEAYRDHLGHGFLYFGLIMALVVAVMYIIPFYWALGTLLGMVLAMAVVWICVIIVLCLQFYFPLCFHMEADSPRKTLRKCFIVVADNLGYSFFLLFRTLFDLVLCFFTATLIPGLAGISVSRMGTVRLLMLRYDYLEENREFTKKTAIWDDILFEERELVGKRTLRNIFFPWKD